MHFQLPYGLHEGALKHISEVERGLKCNCICPACEQPLIARKGDKKMHHFAHYNSSECEKAVETALHIAVKNLLEKYKKIVLPDVILKFSSYKDPWVIAEERLFEFEEVIIENRFDSIVPDVLVYINGRPLIIEVAVTHQIDDFKLAKIRKFDISTIEITLDRFKNLPVETELIEDVIYKTNTKHWAYNSFVEKVRSKFKLFTERKSIIQRGFAYHVDYCPIKARIWRGKPYANVMDDCIHCSYCLHYEYNHILCSGKTKIDSFQQFKDYIS